MKGIIYGGLVHSVTPSHFKTSGNGFQKAQRAQTLRPSKTWIKVKNPEVTRRPRPIDGTFMLAA